MSLIERIAIDPTVVLHAAGADEAEILEDYPYFAAEKTLGLCRECAATQADHTILTAS